MNQFKQEFMDIQHTVRPLRNIADNLREALEDPDQFVVRYQPIINGKTQNADFAKALVRWTSPIFGEILPGRFISVAEKNGLIRSVTKMVLFKVCEDLSKLPELYVCVNISPLDIVDPEFPMDVAHAVQNSGVGPGQIVLEVTDSISKEEAERASANLVKLREQGHSISVSQLDTGSTSFGFVQIRGSTVLKIERDLLEDARQSEEAHQLLQDALNDAHAQGFASLAVGIETQEQANFVNRMGFKLQQGFYHSEALSLDEFLRFSSDAANGAS